MHQSTSMGVAAVAHLNLPPSRRAARVHRDRWTFRCRGKCHGKRHPVQYRAKAGIDLCADCYFEGDIDPRDWAEFEAAVSGREEFRERYREVGLTLDQFLALARRTYGLVEWTGKNKNAVDRLCAKAKNKLRGRGYAAPRPPLKSDVRVSHWQPANMADFAPVEGGRYAVVSSDGYSGESFGSEARFHNRAEAKAFATSSVGRKLKTRPRIASEQTAFRYACARDTVMPKSQRERLALAWFAKRLQPRAPVPVRIGAWHPYWQPFDARERARRWADRSSTQPRISREIPQMGTAAAPSFGGTA